MSSTGAREFEGTHRFEIRGRLGAGGFGVVYRAYDRERDLNVALKMLREMDAGALYRFKNEFRILAEVSHPNLVKYYELLVEGDDWFFTMELVEGSNLLAYVRDESRASATVGLPDWLLTPASAADSPWSDRPTTDLWEEIRRHSPESYGSVRPPSVSGRLREAFRQLAEGVCFLHQAGIIHRDIKPSNVLVDREDRVVLLDFGLAQGAAAIDSTQSLHLLGTPAYVSPEQATGGQVTDASDWYCVGAMLYEALTGRVPFLGSAIEMILAKQRQEPPPPADLVPGLPEDLNRLCIDFLRRSPEARPPDEEVLRRFSQGLSEVRRPSPMPPARRREMVFVGRQSHLKALWEAFESANLGRAITVLVHGPSGLGKSSLVGHFLKELRQRDPAVVVLAGRCYEQESVPYKAIDSLVDNLTQYLSRLPSPQVERILPRDMHLLARLFPVLDQVQAVSNVRPRIATVPDLQELRRRAFTALRELLARLADEAPLVLFIDDLHWGDLDSAALLAELLRPPDSPALLLIVCYRSEDAESSTLPSLLRAAIINPGLGGHLRDLEIEQLSDEEARELASNLLEGNPEAASEKAEVLARESGGHPLFLSELVRHSISAGGADRLLAGAAEITLNEMIRARITLLPDPARRLIEAAAVAGQPVSLEVAKKAAELPAGEYALLGELRSAHLLRTYGTPGKRFVETYHDRIREVALANLRSEELKTYHRHLAYALQETGGAELEMLAVHFHEAGDLEQATRYATQGADHAAGALAFDRAARLYRLALQYRPGDRAEERSLQVKLAGSLAMAGRGGEGAQAYLAAAEGAEPAQRLELRRLAAEQFLISGHVSEGLSVLNTVLALVGMKMPKTTKGALASLLVRRALIRLRGLRFREKPAAEVSSRQLLRIDTCWSVAIGLGMVHSVRGAEFQARHLLLALKAGEPHRVARALAMEVGYSALRGGHTQRRTEMLSQKTLALAQKINDPHALGLATLNAGIAAFLRGEFEKGRRFSDQAESVLREQCTGVAWELDTAQLFGIFCLVWLGEWRELSHRYPAFIKQAEERGDLYCASWLRPRISYLFYLNADDPHGAQEEERQCKARLAHREFDLLHYEDCVVQAEIYLYAGRPLDAWKVISERWSMLERSLVLRVQLTFIEIHCLRARAALALYAALNGVDRAMPGPLQLLHEAEQCANRIEREGIAWGDALASLLRASIAAARGETEKASRLAFQAEEAFRGVHIHPWLLATRRRRGELLGGNEGKAMVEAADVQLRNMTIKNPARMASSLAPGTWSRNP